MKRGIILFAHGSRDAAWARPFERIAASLEKRSPDCAVKLAYLELMRPSLEEAVAALAKQKITAIRVVPLFLGQGGHVKEDLPRIVAAVSADYRGLALTLEPAIGEEPRLIEAIAELISARSS